MEKLDFDLTWAKPYVDQARDDVARRGAISAEGFLRTLEVQLRAIAKRGPKDWQ